MIILGIDPGKQGAATIMGKDGQILDVIEYAKNTQCDIVEAFRNSIMDETTKAYIEKVASSPQMGVKSAFSFGENYGFWIGVLTSFKIPYETVAPQRWQKSLGCLSKGNKNVTKAKAQQLHPEYKITQAIADSILIAEYGRRHGT